MGDYVIGTPEHVWEFFRLSPEAMENSSFGDDEIFRIEACCY
jgi:hypothetical protein